VEVDVVVLVEVAPMVLLAMNHENNLISLSRPLRGMEKA
jgi:hypothetical protein